MLHLPKSFVRCVSYCTASSYNLPAIANFFKRKGYVVRLSKDIVHVSREVKPVDIFFFNYGGFVCWGMTKSQEQKLIEQLLPFSNLPVAHIAMDYFCYVMGDEVSIDNDERLRVDVITLDTEDPSLKLAFSYAIGQSTKLEAFEEAIQDAIRTNSSLPQEIATKGVISLSRRDIFKRIGEIFLVRSSINLNLEYLDTPDFFWRHATLERYFISAKKFLDVPTRVMSLNQKLDVLQELLHILSSQMQQSHTNLLESVIIILILIEIMISLFTFHWGF